MMTRTRSVTLSIVLVGAASWQALAQPEAAPDLSRPEAVAEILLDVARSGDVGALAYLCHPDIPPERLDPRALEICTMTPEHPNFARFRGMFTGSRLGGDAEIVTTDEVTTARVPMANEADGTQLGFVNMIQHDGLWYLRGF